MKKHPAEKLRSAGCRISESVAGKTKNAEEAYLRGVMLPSQVHKADDISFQVPAQLRFRFLRKSYAFPVLFPQTQLPRRSFLRRRVFQRRSAEGSMRCLSQDTCPGIYVFVLSDAFIPFQNCFQIFGSYMVSAMLEQVQHHVLLGGAVFFISQPPACGFGHNGHHEFIDALEL